MKISVITVCKNSESTIENAIQSLITQTAFEFVEYIIIDGASTDDTTNIIGRYRDKIAHFISEPDTGIYNAMNKGIRLATGDYILFLNSDDILYNPYVIQSFLDLASNNFDWLYIGRIELNPPEIKGHISHSEKYFDELRLFYAAVAHTATFFYRKLFERYGLYDENYAIASDYKWFLDYFLIHKGTYSYLDLLVSKFNYGGKSTSTAYNQLQIKERNELICIYYTAHKKAFYSKLHEIFQHDVARLRLRKPLSLLGLNEPYYDILPHVSRFKETFLPKRKFRISKHKDTLEQICNRKCSIARFGDGEFNLIMGKRIGFQKHEDTLAQRLKNILQSEDTEILIGIPSFLNNLFNLREGVYQYWVNYLSKNRRRITELLSYSREYHDTNITRVFVPYKNPGNARKSFQRIRKIWDQRDLLIVEGNNSCLGVGNDLLHNAASIKRIACPNEDAFTHYDKILGSVLRMVTNELVILALGPTATVLAYDLAKAGFQAIDIGHIDFEYEMYLNQYQVGQIRYKYFNEINMRNPEECSDSDYLGQLVLRIP